MPNRHRDDLTRPEDIERFDRDAAYLADLLASGNVEWHPTKPIGEYSYEEIKRKASDFRRQEAAGLTPWNAVARGKHGRENPQPPAGADSATYEQARKTPKRKTIRLPSVPMSKRGGTTLVAPQTTPPTSQPRRQRRAEKTTLDRVADKAKRFHHTDVVNAPNYVEIRSWDSRRMDKIVDRIVSVNPEIKCFISYKDESGYWYTPFAKGIRADALQKLIKEHGSFQAMMDAILAIYRSSPIYGESTDNGVPEYNIIVMDRYLSAHEHLPEPGAMTA